MDLKSLWKERSQPAWTFYCPHCRSERRMRMNHKPGKPIHFFQIGLAAAVFTCATWSWFGLKGLVSFVPFWIAFEIIYRSRVRAALSCPHCGFDPFLYMTDVGRARAEIEKHWRAKFAEKGIPYPEKNVPPSPPVEEQTLTENEAGS